MTLLPEDLRPTSELLWRIHRTSGAHPAAWDEFRRYGPISTMRWDPHPLPTGLHHGFGVIYASTDLRTAVAEVFQTTRRIDPSTGDPHASTFVPTRPLQLLRVYSEDAAWLLRHDASHSLMHGPRATCRRWAAAILDQLDVDGLWVESTMTGQATTVLFEPAASALPARPRATAALASMLGPLDDIARSLSPSWRFADPGFTVPH